MFDRIHWFQGWLIIILIFTGISMLVHYENRGVEQEEEHQKQMLLQTQLIRADIAFVKRNQVILMDDISGVCAKQQSLGLVDTWAASIKP